MVMGFIISAIHQIQLAQPVAGSSKYGDEPAGSGATELVSYSPNNTSVINQGGIRLIGHVTWMGEMENSYRILVGEHEGKIPLGKPRYMWDDDIKMDLKEINFGGVDWIHLAKDGDLWLALWNMVMKLSVPKNVESFLTS
jgi:hypothetical protein